MPWRGKRVRRDGPDDGVFSMNSGLGQHRQESAGTPNFPSSSLTVSKKTSEERKSVYENEKRKQTLLFSKATTTVMPLRLQLHLIYSIESHEHRQRCGASILSASLDAPLIPLMILVALSKGRIDLCLSSQCLQLALRLFIDDNTF
jgi:hypothetical protein